MASPGCPFAGGRPQGFDTGLRWRPFTIPADPASVGPRLLAVVLPATQGCYLDTLRASTRGQVDIIRTSVHCLPRQPIHPPYEEDPCRVPPHRACRTSPPT